MLEKKFFQKKFSSSANISKNFLSFFLMKLYALPNTFSRVRRKLDLGESGSSVCKYLQTLESSETQSSLLLPPLPPPLPRPFLIKSIGILFRKLFQHIVRKNFSI